MKTSILIVEDNSHKQQKIIHHVKSLVENLEISTASSFSSGSKLAIENEFDIIIIDMSLPTFDRSDTDAGHRTRTFGGRELARKIVRKNKASKLIFITQYESFSDHGRTLTFSTLKEYVAKECGDFYYGFIMYDSSKTAWKFELEESIKKALNENPSSR